jgi:hypothetical protein
MSSAAEPWHNRPANLAGVLLAVFFVTLSVLALEIGLTRVFSVLLRYHYLFLVLSLAVCGLGFGGVLDLLALRPLGRRLAVEMLLAVAAWAAAGAILLTAWALLATPLVVHLTSLWVMSAVCFVPFLFCGAFLSCAFRTASAAGGWVYAADLSGAALGSILVIVGLQAFGGTNTLLATAMAISLAPLALGAVTRHPGLLVPAAIATVVVGGLVGGNVARGWLDVPAIPPSNAPMLKRLYQQLGDPATGKRLLYTEWDAFARTDVVLAPDPHRPGSAVIQVYTDGEVPTQMIPFSGDQREAAAFIGINPDGEGGDPPGCFPGFVPFLYFGADRMLSIGSGGGLDVHLGLLAGSRQIDCVDVNPSLPRIMALYRKWHGGIYDCPNVRLYIDDGRSFVHRATQPYDMIYMALTQTDTTTAGTLNPVEAYSVTREGFHDYLSRLSPDGTYVFIIHDDVLLMRAFLTILDALRMDGISRTQALDHVALYTAQPQEGQPYRDVVVVRRQSWTGPQARQFADGLIRFGHHPVFFPGVYEPPPFVWLRDPDMDTEAMLHRLDAPNMLPCTDDRPFFLDTSWGIPPDYARFGAAIAGGAGCLLLAACGGAWWWAKRRGGVSAARPVVLLWYFAALGVGFMLVEVVVAQKLLRALPYPALALAVILFALLLGAGAGSALSQRWPSGRALTRAAGLSVLVALLVGAGGRALDQLVDVLLPLPLTTRCLPLIGVLFPLGLLMGTPFPSGIRALGDVATGLVPLGWAINGLTSVVGSLLAVLLGRLWGFSAALLVGAGVYVLAAGLGLVAQYARRDGGGGEHAVSR